ncbi:MAG TPA: FAD:protein FMN transferase [Verrucomicrobiae bacterium]|jgi:thiamine biosynthesis lipoprotein|nr:FAD:protein FMN transferase [Verrucomicrobiae bacterium]
MKTVALARNAMATRFELLLHGENEAALRAAGEEALGEIDRVESQLSLYLPTSEIAHVNARAAAEPVRVSPNVFHLLEHCRQLTHETKNAFDISLGALTRCWGFMGGLGRVPTSDEINTARERTGMRHVELNPENFTVRFKVPGVILDLGAIGKGYAIERAVGLLREAGITSALIHGGTSSVYGIGSPPGTDAWQITLDCPEPPAGTEKPQKSDLLVTLRDEALSVSGNQEKSFQQEGKTYGHIMHSRPGMPASGIMLAAVAMPSVTESDALSTAAFLMGAHAFVSIAASRPKMRAWFITDSPEAERPGYFLNRLI